MAESGGLENRCTSCVPWVRIPLPPPSSCLYRRSAAASVVRSVERRMLGRQRSVMLRRRSNEHAADVHVGQPDGGTQRRRVEPAFLLENATASSRGGPDAWLSPLPRRASTERRRSLGSTSSAAASSHSVVMEGEFLPRSMSETYVRCRPQRNESSSCDNRARCRRSLRTSPNAACRAESTTSATVVRCRPLLYSIYSALAKTCPSWEEGGVNGGRSAVPPAISRLRRRLHTDRRALEPASVRRGRHTDTSQPASRSRASRRLLRPAERAAATGLRGP